MSLEKKSVIYKTATVFCDGSSDFASVEKGKYSIDFSLQIISIFVMLFLGLRFFLKMTTKKTKFFTQRFDLFKLPFLEQSVRKKYFSFFIRLLPALLFVFVLLTGFLGRSRLSFAAPFVWMFWWTLLIFMVAFAGKVFCAICPWDFFANLFQYGSVYQKKKVKEAHLKKWPKLFKNTYPAIIFFIILTWLELGFEITKNSYATASLGLIVVMLAIGIPVWFEKRAFCRYLCPVGRISGLYAIFSPLELRVKSVSICQECRTKDCVKGNEYSSACPMELVPFNIKENTYCTLCTECIRSCDHNNLTIKLRPFASEINNAKPQMKKDESVFSYVIFALTFFHGITMVFPWFQTIDIIRNKFDMNYMNAFSVLMILFIFLNALIYLIFEKTSFLIMKDKRVFRNLTIVLIPLTLAYHLGHNVMHVFGEIPYLVSLVNDPFGWGSDVFGMKGFVPKPFLLHEDVLGIQVLLIIIGFYCSLKTLRIKLESLMVILKNDLLKLQFLYFVGFSVLFFVSLFSFWLIGQPMVVRGGI